MRSGQEQRRREDGPGQDAIGDGVACQGANAVDAEDVVLH